MPLRVLPSPGLSLSLIISAIACYAQTDAPCSSEEFWRIFQHPDPGQRTNNPFCAGDLKSNSSLRSDRLFGVFETVTAVTRKSGYAVMKIIDSLSAGALLLSVLLPQNCLARCHRIQRPGYSVCVPSNWRVTLEHDPDSASTLICKPNAGRCLKNKDPHPYPGVLIVDIDLADGLHRSSWKTPSELVVRDTQPGEPPPPVEDVPLLPEHSRNRKCWVVRTLLYGDLWEEDYGLVVNDHRFAIHVSYNDEPANIKSYRSSVIDILSSIMPTSK
jgi:hypothetical protein